MALATRIQVRELLKSDVSASSRVRVKAWEHVGEDRLDAPVNAHQTVELAWVEAGGAIYRVAGREWIVRAGEAFVVPAGVEHSTSFLPSTRAGSLAIVAAMIGDVADAMGARRGVELGPVASARATVVGLGRVLQLEAQTPGPGQLLATESIADAMAVALLRQSTPRPSPGRDGRIVAALDEIVARYADPIQIDDLARSAGLGRFHFTRLFRDQVGQAPYQYLLRFRLERAAEQLRRGRHSVTDVALAVGFDDMSRFARMFRRQFGVSPSEYARARSA